MEIEIEQIARIIANKGMKSVVPLPIYNQRKLINNGSMVLIKCYETVLGVTAIHVWDEIKQNESYIYGIELTVLKEKGIYFSEKKDDIAIMKLPDRITKVLRENDHGFEEFQTGEATAQENQPVFILGYPGVLTKETNDGNAFGLACLHGFLSGPIGPFNGDNFMITFDYSKGIPIYNPQGIDPVMLYHNKDNPDRNNLGGLSGGAIILVAPKPDAENTLLYVYLGCIKEGKSLFAGHGCVFGQKISRHLKNACEQFALAD